MQQPAAAPPVHLLSGLATTADGTQVVLFGGQAVDGTISDDPWTFDATGRWTARCGTAVGGATTPCGPPGRIANGLATGPGGVVLYGGDVGSTGVGDTWVWDGRSWSQRCATATCGPGPRVAPALAGNADETVLFGGGDNADTWIFDGSRWSQTCGPPLGTPCGPPALVGASMTWDGSRFLLVAGSPTGSGTTADPVDDVWAFDGTRWTRLCGTTAGRPCGPAGRAVAGLAAVTHPDPALDGVVLTGGSNLLSASATVELQRDVWRGHDGTWSPLTPPWPSTPEVLANGANPPVGPAPLLALAAALPARCMVVIVGNESTGTDGAGQPVFVTATYLAGWDVTGSGRLTGCARPPGAPPTTTTTTTTPATTTTTAGTAPPTTTASRPPLAAPGHRGIGPDRLAATGRQVTMVTIVGLALLGVGAALAIATRPGTRRRPTS